MESGAHKPKLGKRLEEYMMEHHFENRPLLRFEELSSTVKQIYLLDV